jgi:hypothetical protein
MFSPISGHKRHYQKVDCAHSKLGYNSQSVGDPVRRPAEFLMCQSVYTEFRTPSKDMKNAINDLSAETKDNSLFIYRGLPQTGLISKHFLHRAFAVWGHFVIAQLIVSFILGSAYLLLFVVLLRSFVK